MGKKEKVNIGEIKTRNLRRLGEAYAKAKKEGTLKSKMVISVKEK